MPSHYVHEWELRMKQRRDRKSSFEGCLGVTIMMGVNTDYSVVMMNQ